MSQDLRILINSALDMKKSTQQINQDLKLLASKIDKLKLDIGIDPKQIQLLNKELKNFKNILNNVHFKNPKIFDPDLLKKQNIEVFKDIDSAIKKYGQLGQVSVNKTFSPITKELQSFTFNIEKANGEVEKLKFNMINIANGNNLEQAFKLDSIKQIDNTSKIAEKVLQKEHEINRQKQINVQQEKEKTLQLQQQLNLYQRQSAIKIQELIRQYPSIDRKQLDVLMNQVNSLSVSTPHLRNRMKELTTSLREVEVATKGVTANTNTMAGAFQNAMLKFPIWMAASTAFFGSVRSISSLLDVIVSVDTAMVSLKKVMDDETNFDVMLDSSIKKAKELAKTVDDVLDSFTEFARQGFSQQEIDFLSQASLLASNVGEIQAQRAAEYITSALIQFKMEAKDSMEIIDSWNEISNNYATTVERLAQGVARAGAVSRGWNMDLHQLNAIIGTVTAATKQSGNEVGNFVKFVLPRLTSNKAQDALAQLNISITDQNGELRNAFEIYRDVAEAIHQVNSEQKMMIIEALSGKHHISRMTAMLDNWKLVEEQLATSITSKNSAMEENKVYMESLEAQTNILKATFQDMALQIGEAGLTDIFRVVLRSLTSLAKGFSDLTSATSGWNLKLPILTAGLYGAYKVLKLIPAAARAAQLSFGWIGIAVVGVQLLASAFMGSVKATEMNTQALMDNARVTESNADKIEQLVNRYNELKNESKLTVEKQEELNTVLDKINAIAPHIIDKTNEYGDAMSLNAEKADAYIESLRALTNEQLKQALLAGEIEASQIQVDIDKLEKEISKAENIVKDSYDKIRSFQEEFDVLGLNDAKEKYEQVLSDLVSKREEAFKDGNTELYANLGNEIGRLIGAYTTYKKLMEDSSGTLAKYSQSIGELQEKETRLSSIQDRNKLIIDMINGTISASEVTEYYTSVLDDEIDALDELEESLSNSTETTWENITATELLMGVNAENVKQMKQAIEVVTILSQVENLNAQQKEMLAGAIGYLESMYPHLAGRIQENIGFLYEEMQAMELLGKQSSDTTETLIKAQDDATLATLTAIDERINGYNEELEALKKLQKAFISDLDLDPYNWSNLDQVNDQINSIKSNLAGEYEARRNLLYGSGIIERPKDKEKKEKEKKIVDPYEINQYTQSINYLDTQIKLIDGQMSRLSKTSDEYSKALNEQVYLLDMKQKKMSEERKSIDAQIVKLQEQLAVTKDIEKQNEMKKQIESLTSTRDSLKTGWWDVDAQKHSKIYERQMLLFNQLSKSVEEYDHNLSISQAKQNKYEEGTVDWNKELLNQNKIFQDKRVILLEQIDVLEKLLATGRLLPDQEEDVQKQLRATRLEYEKLNDTMIKQYEELKKQREKLAEDAISVMKEVYQKQKDLALKAIDEELKALEVAHKKKMDMYDQELSKFEEITNAKIRSIDDEADEEDFLRNRAKLQSEIASLESRYNVLLLDNSHEANVKREELLDQIDKKREELELMGDKRSRDLRKRNLQDELDTYRKDMDGKRKTEKDKYDREKERLEQVRSDTEYHYNELLNNEREFSRIREEIMSGNIENLQTQLDGFLSYFKKINKDAAKEIGQSYQELLNIIDRVNNVSGSLSSIPSSPVQNVSGNRESAWDTYLNNKKKAEEGHRSTGKWDENLFNQNERLRQQYGFPDGSFDQLKNLKKYHTGGVVGGSSNKLSNLINKFFNLRPDEEVAKLLKGEVVISPQGIKNFIPNMNALVSPMSQNSNPSAVGTNTGGLTISGLELNINLRSGGRREGELVAEGFMDILRRQGANV